MKRLKRIWSHMKQRCYNPNDDNYHKYGGRGIKICDEWLKSPEKFYDWALANGYTDNLTLDRKDNNGNYEPENCRWATVVEQNNNKRIAKNMVLVEIDGTIDTIPNWSRKTGINYNTLKSRYNNGWRGRKLLKGGVTDGE